MSAVVKENRNLQLRPGKFALAESKNHLWHAIVEFGTRREDVLKPEFWAYVAVKFIPRDQIDVFAEDGTFYSRLLVVRCDRTWASVTELQFVDLTKVKSVADQVSGDYNVRFLGPKGWSVIRKVDNAVLQDKLHSEENAKDWLRIHLESKSA